MSDDNRNITDSDAKAIATELKKQIMEDFKLEVGAGVLIWVKRAVIVLLLYLAVVGINGDKSFLHSLTTGSSR